MALINSMSMRGKVILAACAVAFLAAVFLVFRMASAPSYVTVMSGIDATRSADITAALSAAGISGHLINAGTELQVPQGSEDKAVTALAQKGLSAGRRQGGFADTLDKQKLGASSIQQKVAYQRGLEGEIANSISAITGVGNATVNLTLPDQTAFVGAEQQQGATAAVVLGADASALAPDAVRGIASVVASSVPQLKISDVTITDATGALVWPTGDAGGSGGGASTKAAAEAARSRATEAQLNAFLDQTLGAGKARVHVNYDLNMDKVSQEQLAYANKGPKLHAESAKETLKGSGSVPGGTAGVQSNVPTYSGATGAAGGTNTYTQTTGKADYAIGKTITKTDKASGAINAMRIGLIYDTSLTTGNAAIDKPALEAMVKNAAGFVPGRDSLSSVAASFPKTVAPKPVSPLPPAMMGLVKGLAIGIGALLFLFLFSRYLKRRESDELLDEPSWLRQLPRPAEAQLIVPDDMQSAGGVAAIQASAAAAFANDPRRRALQEVVDNEPERVAAHLRSWITEDGA